MGITISHLPASTPANIDGTAVVPMDDNTGVTVKVTIPELTAAIGSTIAELPAINPTELTDAAVLLADGADGVAAAASVAQLRTQLLGGAVSFTGSAAFPGPSGATGATL